MRRFFVLCGALGVFAAVLGFTPPPASRADEQHQKPAIVDADLFDAIITDLQHGAAYHDAFGAEARRLHYPTASIFNWRQPLLSWTLAYVPHATWALYAMAALLLVAAWHVQGRWLTPVLLLPVIVPIATSVVAFTELWAGLLLGLSAVAYLARRPIAAVLCAMLALALRELAAPYCVTLTLAAIWRRDWPEVRAWAVGLLLYIPYYGWHAWEVHRHVGPADLSHPHSWLALGGPVFLLRILQFTSPIFMASTISFAIAMTCALLVLVSEATPRSLLLGLLPYVPFFLLVGQGFNVYWGLMVAPLFALWLSYTPDAIQALRAPQRHSSVAPAV